MVSGIGSIFCLIGGWDEQDIISFILPPISAKILKTLKLDFYPAWYTFGKESYWFMRVISARSSHSREGGNPEYYIK
ncbi:MAG: hypothetical protein ACE14V_12725 [bacterium]